ncbi:hypothetical protein [Bacillus atrophaeus]|uniref:hypothetical protein n=1 Tax=Bacillus atrophaeus TaxID=1452 RepID=UPI002E1B5E79|nr:hypothetical protein [Bacillus atrophaeus]
MNLAKKYSKDNTITISVLGPDGQEQQTIENVSLEGARGLLVVTIDEEFSTYEEAEMIRRSIREAITSIGSIASLVVPSYVKIDYIKF